MLEILPVRQLKDNYAYLAFVPKTRRALVVDAAEPGPILAAVEQANVVLEAILSTHHHPDHVGGNLALLAAQPGLRVFGAAADQARIPGITDPLTDRQAVEVIGLRGEMLFVPCHTRGHVAYRFQDRLFTGDTLFSGGCGRFFEGDAADMYRALYEVIGGLDEDTWIYPGHEYTQKNLEFAASLEPNNPDLAQQRAQVAALLDAGRPTIPSTLGAERRFNPFLRVRSPELVAAVIAKHPGLDGSDPIAVLAAVRAMKDVFA
ncbi:MAG: hydroxyacylglutathione hydrolase [Myxococcota bacterium]